MKMPSGGPFMLVSGQVTDDSELAMCIMHGILANKESIVTKNEFKMDRIAEYYGKWMLSDPFDMG